MSSESMPSRSSRLTGPGRSAIAVISVCGDQASLTLADLIRLASDRPYRIGQVRYGTWIGDGSGGNESVGESVVLVPLEPNAFEIHCHGGKAAAERILADLDRAGIESSPPPMVEAAPSIRTADDATEQCMIEEAIETLSHCQTTTTAAIAMDQVRGALVDWRKRALGQLTSADGQTGSAAQQIAGQAAELTRAGRVTGRLSHAIDVVLCGPPNVGKSSLINAMVGYDRSITMDMEGTTRDVLDVETAYRGWPLRLRDTAGLHTSTDSIEQHGMDHALAAVRQSDIVVLVSQPGRMADRKLIPSDSVIIEVMNKSDLDDASSEGWLRTVATENRGVQPLLDRIVSLWTADLPPPGHPVPINSRQLAWVRSIADAKDDPTSLLERLQNA